MVAWPCDVAGVGLVWRGEQGPERSLTEGFDSACDPALGLDGKTLYFAGRREIAGDSRIWQLRLSAREVAAVTPNGVTARRPLPLPDGSVAFVSDGDLFRVRPTDPTLERLTFTQGRLQTATLLPDGRVLFLSSNGEMGRLFWMLPDGTWTSPWPGFEDLSVWDFTVVGDNRLLVLDASEQLWLADIADPYAPRSRVSVDFEAKPRKLHRAGREGAILVAEVESETGAVSTRVGVLRLDPGPGFTELDVFENRTVLALDSAGPAPRVDPLPSIVKPEMETGFLFVIDVSRTDDPTLRTIEREEIAALRIVRIERSGARTLLSGVAPAADGSVYLEVPADTPLVLELIDRRGGVLAETQTPVWVRPNERRGCLGCHVSPAYAPPNVLPDALLQEPHRVTDVSGVSR